ncbi:AAA family ATPase [Streptomyces californicus]|uniref:AAA family ATPase n=1 Tax=Streptomyces californicus TaxID=67351 RepID=UPI00379F49D5
MICWLNGPFGGGKSTLAADLRHALGGAVIADPEGVGELLRGALKGHDRQTRDYQDHPPWRALTLAFITGLADYTGGPLLVPMTVLDPRYADELFTPLRHHPAGFRHIVLHCAPDPLEQRIADSDEFPGDPLRSDAVRAYRRRRAADYQSAAASWMHVHGHVIDTSTLTAGQTLQAALAHLHTAEPSAGRLT